MGTASDTAQYVGLLNVNQPADTNDPTNGAAAIRQVKNAVKQSLPHVDGAVNATDTELNYLVGVTSAIQTQLNAKAPVASPTFTADVTLDAASGYPTVMMRPNDDTTFAGRFVMQNAAGTATRFVLVADEGNDQLYLQWYAADGATLRGQIAIDSSNNVVFTPGTGGNIEAQHTPASGNDVMTWDALVSYLASWDDTAVVANVADGAIATAKLAADAVTGAKIADDAVDAEHLATDSVRSDAIRWGVADSPMAQVGTGLADAASFNLTTPGLYIVTATGALSVKWTGTNGQESAAGFYGGCIYSDGNVELHNDTGTLLQVYYTKMS